MHIVPNSTSTWPSALLYKDSIRTPNGVQTTHLKRMILKRHWQDSGKASKESNTVVQTCKRYRLRIYAHIHTLI